MPDIVEYPHGATFPGMIGRTVDQSSPAWPEPTRANESAPNVLDWFIYGGIARVGADLDQGVVDHNGEVYGNPGLFVTDGSVLPAAPGVPPALSIAAWAHYVSDRMAQRQM